MEPNLFSDGKVITRVWLIRFAVSLICTGLVAWGMSFRVADYVVRANTASIHATFSGIERSLGEINASIQASTQVLIEMKSQAATQGTEIGYIRRDLGRVQAAVQDFGIQIPAVGKVEGGFVINTAKWDELQKLWGTTGNEPIFLEISNDILPK